MLTASADRAIVAGFRVRAQVRLCGRQTGTGVDFLRVLRFPLPILIPLTAPHSSSIIRHPCEGGVEYLHRDPANRKRRRNGTKKSRAIA
jgi:hypothetical protein